MKISVEILKIINMEQEFIDWYNSNKLRFHHAQFSDCDIAYSAWLEGKSNDDEELETIEEEDLKFLTKNEMILILDFVNRHNNKLLVTEEILESSLCKKMVPNLLDDLIGYEFTISLETEKKRENDKETLQYEIFIKNPNGDIQKITSDMNYIDGWDIKFIKIKI